MQEEIAAKTWIR